MGIEIFAKINIENLVTEANHFSHEFRKGELIAFVPFCHPLVRI
jgi:hypothetical protein